MPCDQTGGRADRHTGEEGGAEQQGGAEPPRAIVHAPDPLSAMPDQRAFRSRLSRSNPFAPKAPASSDQLLRTAKMGGISEHIGMHQETGCRSTMWLASALVKF